MEHTVHLFFTKLISIFHDEPTAIKESRTKNHCFPLVLLRLCTSIVCCPLSFLSFILGWNEYQMPLNTSGNLSHLFWSGYKGHRTAENQTKIKLLFSLLYKFKWSITFWIEWEKDIKIDFKRGKKWRKDNSELEFLLSQSVFLTMNHTISICRSE